MIWEIFVIGAVLIVAFLFWYRSSRGPLTPAEISALMAKLKAQQAEGNTDLEQFRMFLEADDGKEFCMANFIELNKGDLKHPDTGVPLSAHTLLRAYADPFIKRIMKRACHPVYQAVSVGTKIDTSGTEDRMQFGILSMVRYRSRRDFAEIAAANDLPGIHRFKLLAIESTINIPTQIAVSLFMRPIYYVPVLILLVCCLLHLGWLLIAA